MKRKSTRRAGWAIGCLAAIAIFLVSCAISWAVTCGIVKLITMCFGWTFSIGIATGIWLIMFLLCEVFGHIRKE